MQLDFSCCQSREELYALMAERMLWQAAYGRNLDALYDILTGLPHYGRCFVIRLPEMGSPVFDYAGRIAEVFREAGVPVRTE
ncbi:MAG: barstar family protein [Candidatus Limivicinus sp.]